MIATKSKLYDRVYDDADAALRAYCSRSGFLLSGRIKSLDSLTDKIESGRYASIDDIDDMIAFSVIVDTTDQIRDVTAFLKSAFTIKTARVTGTLRDERVFDFDCPRYYCQIKSASGSSSSLSDVVFEVQIRTILQHAWSKITHKHVYKPLRFDYRSSRLAAEIMAQLESIDRVFANFEGAAAGVRRVTRRGMGKRLAVTKMIDELVTKGVIPSEMRPSNGRRLGDNIYEAISDPDNNADNAISALKNFYVSQEELFPRSVSLFQMAVVCLYRNGYLESGGGSQKSRYYFITDELLTIFPEVANIVETFRISPDAIHR